MHDPHTPPTDGSAKTIAMPAAPNFAGTPAAVPPPTTASSTTGWVATIGLVLLGVILLGAGALPWWLSEPSRISAFIAKAAPNLHGDVVIGRARLGWFGPVVLEDLIVVPRNGTREPISIRKIEGSHGLAAILLSVGDLGVIRVEGMETHLVFDANRDSNIKGLLVDAALPKPAGGTPGPKKSPLRLRLEVEDAIVRIEGPWAPDPWISDPIDVQLTLSPAAGGSFSEWSIEPTEILKDAKLDASIAQGVLAYIAPVLADSTRTSGRFSLRIDGATFPVGAPEKAEFAGKLTMHAVDLGPGPMVEGILAALPGRMKLPTSIRIADDSNVVFHMADRRVWHEGLEFGVPLARAGSRLDLSTNGSVGLDDKVLDLKLALPIPTDLPTERAVLASLGGKTLSIGIGGVLGKPKINFDGSIRNVAADVIAGVIDRIRNRNQPAQTQEALPRGPTPLGAAVAGSDPTTAPAAELPPAGRLPPPPPRPNWVPPKRPGVAPQVVSPGDKPQPAGLPEPAAGEEENQPGGATSEPGSFAGPADARPTAPEASDSPGGTAQVLDQLKNKLPAEVGGNPTTDRIIDLVGGLIDEVGRRRAERAAAEAASPNPSPDPGQPPPAPSRRGRLLKRLLQPQPPAPAAPQQP